MPSIAGQSSIGALRFNFRTLALAAVPSLYATTGSVGDALTARAMAGAGLAAVLGLPLLLISSIVLSAPLAVPAAIACGYLAISHALAANRPRRAALISALVLTALVGWLILYLAQGEDSLSRTGMAAALMAPLFAAAPAAARSVLAHRRDGDVGAAPGARAAALQRVACLNELAPTESVLIADRDGLVLAATGAGRRQLRLLPEGFEQSVASVFAPHDVPDVAQALRSCRARGAPVEIAVGDFAGGEGHATWIASPCENETVSLRLLQQVSGVRPALDVKREEYAPPASTASPACDLGEAVAFAMRRARPRGSEKGIEFTVERDPEIIAACDRQVGRRIAHLAIESALVASAASSTIRVDARKLKGIVLLRVTSEIADDGDADETPDLATLKALVDDAGGTLVVDRQKTGQMKLSVRLALVNIATTTERVTERAEAG